MRTVRIAQKRDDKLASGVDRQEHGKSPVLHVFGSWASFDIEDWRGSLAASQGADIHKDQVTTTTGISEHEVTQA